MNITELIYQHAKHLPQPKALEVLDFIEFLEAKQEYVPLPWHQRTAGISWNGKKPAGGKTRPRLPGHTAAKCVLDDRG